MRCLPGFHTNFPFSNTLEMSRKVTLKTEQNQRKRDLNRHFLKKFRELFSFLVKRLDDILKCVHNSIFASGGMSEWLKEADCKSVGPAPTLVRIQLPPPALF